MERTQCRFKSGVTETVAWIDSKYAKVGLFVQLLGLGEMFWEVKSTGATSTEDMSHRHKTYNNNI